jgi:hypothetical protein
MGCLGKIEVLLWVIRVCVRLCEVLCKAAYGEYLVLT